MKTRIKPKLPEEAMLPNQWPLSYMNELLEYWTDAWQGSILLLDVLRQRGNNYVEYYALEVPHVLSFEAELILEGRSLPRPVNYGLVRIVPPKGTAIDRRKRPSSCSTRAPATVPVLAA